MWSLDVMPISISIVLCFYSLTMLHVTLKDLVERD